MELLTISIEKPDGVNLILGQSHFIKTVEDVHEALVTAVPGIRFGLAFCESSGPALVRASGTNDELVELVSTTLNQTIQRELFAYFEDREVAIGEDAALEFLAAWEDKRTETVISAVSYLASLEQEKAVPILESMLDSGEEGIVSAALRGLGTIGGRGTDGVLIAKLEDDDLSDDLRDQVILALGDLGSEAALEPLVAIVENRDARRVERMYACTALGRIGEAEAIATLEAVLSEQDALLRAYAASALAELSGGGGDRKVQQFTRNR